MIDTDYKSSEADVEKELGFLLNLPQPETHNAKVLQWIFVYLIRMRDNSSKILEAARTNLNAKTTTKKEKASLQTIVSESAELVAILKKLVSAFRKDYYSVQDNRVQFYRDYYLTNKDKIGSLVDKLLDSSGFPYLASFAKDLTDDYCRCEDNFSKMDAGQKEAEKQGKSTERQSSVEKIKKLLGGEQELGNKQQNGSSDIGREDLKSQLDKIERNVQMIRFENDVMEEIQEKLKAMKRVHENFLETVDDTAKFNFNFKLNSKLRDLFQQLTNYLEALFPPSGEKGQSLFKDKYALYHPTLTKFFCYLKQESENIVANAKGETLKRKQAPTLGHLANLNKLWQECEELFENLLKKIDSLRQPVEAQVDSVEAWRQQPRLDRSTSVDSSVRVWRKGTPTGLRKVSSNGGEKPVRNRTYTVALPSNSKK